MDREKVPSELAKLPIDEQLDIYLYLKTNVHPPINYGEDIAMQGDAVVPGVRAALTRARGDRERALLIDILGTMARLRAADGVHDPVTTAVVRQAIQTMESERYRESALRDLQDIVELRSPAERLPRERPAR
jgi:hypothetical protein